MNSACDIRCVQSASLAYSPARNNMRRVLALCLFVSCAVAQHQQEYADYADYAGSQQQQRPAPRAINRPPQGPEPPKPTPVAILKQINRHNDDGSYTYGFEGADGTFKIETKLANGDVRGKYGFVDDTGKVRTVEYGADKYGFQPAGEGITVAPPTLVDESLTEEDFPSGQPQQQYRPQAAPKPRKQKPRPVQAAPVQQYAAAPVQHYAAAPAAPQQQQYAPAPQQQQQQYRPAPAPQQYAAPAPQQQYRPAPAPQQLRAAPAPQQQQQQYRPAPVAPQGGAYEQQTNFARPTHYQVVEQPEVSRSAAPTPPRRIQVAGAAPVPPRAEIPGAAPVPRRPTAAAPRAGPPQPQQYRPAPQAAAPQPQQYFQPAPQYQQQQAAPQQYQQAAPAPVHYQPAPAARAPQAPKARAYPAGGSILDQLAKDYALPQGGGAPLHDITFSGF